MPDDILSMLGNENPQAPPPKEEGDMLNESLDDELFASMLTADGEDGNFEMKQKEKKEEQKPEVKISAGKIKERLGKYSKDFMDSVLKDPSKYTIETPQGRMTVKDAIMKGFDPTTGEFNDAMSIDKIKEKHLSGLNENDRAVAEQLMNPANAQMSPVDAEQYGLSQDSPMIAGNQVPMSGDMQAQDADGQDALAGIDPAILQKMMGGKL